ncbi:SPOR domain-containing protein [Deferribacterales bacterium Es71-Z0220]|jgi:cell division septation protein DedD|uniref:SPOR domain-containing protein n=1 Tax=Deferrivibrio essentukiensis TaxID=2880922 RepID=UPI001F60DC73|nr:SPOR domain-containing protein [Deferrivibrio essentukiensis]MCB4205059.1 SPOR domain-containing protein [Deferrivibrio essentukiensis]
MRDIDKIKEKKEKDEVKSILGFVLLFLIVFGIITFAIIKLTTQYFTLKKELEESKNVQVSATPVEDGKKLEYKLDGDKIKVSELKEVAEKAAEDSLKENLSGENEQKIGGAKEPEKVIKEEVKKEALPIQVKKNENINQESSVEIKPEKKPENKPIDEKIKVEEKPKSIVNNTAHSGVYAVQLMAFKDESDAKSVVQKYKNDIPDIYYIKADLGTKGVWYRVRCCSSSTLDEAKNKLQDINEKYKIKGFIVKN